MNKKLIEEQLKSHTEDARVSLINNYDGDRGDILSWSLDDETKEVFLWRSTESEPMYVLPAKFGSLPLNVLDQLIEVLITEYRKGFYESQADTCRYALALVRGETPFPLYPTT
jgi:hypothetical protein